MSYGEVKLLNKDGMRDYLQRGGISSDDAIEKIISGFDLTQPVYEQPLEAGDVLWQYIRDSSFYELSPVRGSWFCLQSATMEGLAITSGLAGRRQMNFQVLEPFKALEGIAIKQRIDFSWSGGGPGGQTQIFVPPAFAGRIGGFEFE